ncbi:MAG: permease [Labilithrix sp.]|nr:permease [Labilithrix sp.]
MSLLVLSIVALALGPGIVALAGARSWVLALVDGFVIVTIGGIALIHILPHALLSCGAWAFLGAAAGLVGPMLLERKDHPRHDHVGGGDAAKHRPAMVLALLGIAIHAFLDGSAFAEHDDAHGHAHSHGGGELLALAVVLHRIPEGLAIWWLVRPRRGGIKTAVVALSLVAVATVFGSRFGDELAHGAGAAVFAFVQAVVAGSLLHVVIHHAPPSVAWTHHHHHASAGRGRPPGAHVHGPGCGHAGHDESDDAARVRAAYASLSGEPDPHHERGLQIAPALGALFGMALLFFVSTSHPTAQQIAHEIAMGPTFVTLALESAPALLVAYVASGLVHAFLPRSVVAWLSKGEALSQSLRGLLVGPLLPVCSCGVLPLYRSMLARGAPRAAALTLLVAAPELGLATFLVSWSLLGGTLTVVRGVAAIVTAVAVGYGVTRLARRPVRAEAVARMPSLAPPQPLRARLWSGIRYGLGDTVDHTTPWIMIGLALAAFAEPLLDSEAVARVSPWVEVPVFAALGVPMYVCASGATPLVAVLLHKGVSPGAAIAFLLTGPATNLTTFGVLRSLHGKRLAALFAAAMVTVPTALGWIVNVGLPRDRPETLHVAAHEPATPIEIASLVVLGVLVAVSLVRHGPRHMVAQLVTTTHEH